MDNRYYGSYRRYTFDWDYADQEEYTRYEDELNNLELKEVISDEEYNNNVSRLEALNDMEELERYRNNYVSESEYFFSREELVASMNELETRYHVTEDMKQEDREMRARFTKDKLRMIKKTYEARGISNTITNLDLDYLSNDEVISMYAYVTRDKTEEEIRDLELGSVRDRVSGYVNPEPVPTPEPIPEPSPVSSDEEEIVTLTDIENELNRFRETSDRINNQMNEVNRKLVLGDLEELDVTDTINGLDTEISELREMGKVILDDMDKFRLEIENADFSMSPSEVNNTIKGFTNRFKDLKVMHQTKYNARVEYTNNKIDELKAMTGLDDEVRGMIESLSKLDRSDKVIKNYTQKNYLNDIDYNRLVEVNKQIDEIQSRLGVKSVDDDNVEGLETEMSEIERHIGSVETELATELSDDRIKELVQDLKLILNDINDFKQKLAFNKEKLSDEEYNNYMNRVEIAANKLNELTGKLEKSVTLDDDYKELEEKVNGLSNDVDRLDNDVEALRGHIVESGKLVFADRVKDLADKIADLINNIVSKRDSMEVSQYDSLMNKVNNMETKLSNVSDKVKDPGMIKGVDIFAVLNSEINKLGIDLDNLDTTVKSAEKPIKREDRKGIDKIINHLGKEINRLEKLLEQYKDKDEEKYNSTLEELNKLKTKLNEVNGEYKKKCPLMVKAVKSAKNFFKKHKKACLIIAGLAAMALVSHHVLIPAIMHGNIMIAGTSPVLRPFIKFTNNILGGMIGATKDSLGIWTLANGVSINPSCAASSLLKGLAISGISSTALIAPLVVAIKKLVERMKTVKLKQKLSESFEKGKETVKNTTGKVKEKVKTVKPIMPKNYDKLCKEYINSEMTLEEFCKEKNLNEKEMEIINLKSKLIDAMKENKSKKRGK